MNDELWNFAEAAGSWFAQAYGLPRMTGRVFGWLLVCDPVEQTAAQLAESLGASRGSISQATGMLVRQRLIDRIRIRGERFDRFRIRPSNFEDSFADPQLGAARALLRQGIEALEGEPPWRRARLEELDAFYAWWERRVPELLDEWRASRAQILKGDGDD